MEDTTKRDELVVLGCGDVGRRVVETLKYADIKFTVVDSNEQNFENADYNYVVGNATEEDVLIQAEVPTASTVIVSLNDDTDVMFATLITRGLNPSSTIIARANSYRSIDKIYKAGADYVAALPIVAGQMLAKMTSSCLAVSCNKMDEDIMLYEGIDIEKHTVIGDRGLANKTVLDIDLRNRFGCTIIGIERNGTVITDILPSTVIREGDIVAVVGGKEEIAKFKEKYVKVKLY
ncbi:potassium channel family protein [Methanolobus profundi]|uniref:Trk K+ transport system, NAD-binding component n=1 Tax=Methanolobus profundi TaxID=487685 RepID=A0A1I4PY80_9EURY|nr:TrkA family potassium uptake protein [Methanolobus profundi]SFM32704.1 Trk K+ transport system, NAD-binding component [Methanolobus profundi]